MVDSEDTSQDGLQRHPSNTGVPRGSKLPRRGQKNGRRQNAGRQSADTASVGHSRQNSVKSLDKTDPLSLASQTPSAPEPGSASERDAKRRSDKASKIPRSPDFSSPEPAPDTGADKSPVTPDRQSRVPWAPPSPSVSEGGKTQQSPPQHTSVGAVSLGSSTSDGRSSPATLGDTTPPFRAGTLFKKGSRKAFQKSTKADMAQPAEPNAQSGQPLPKEESFIQVSEAPTIDLHGKNLDDADGKSDGRPSAQKQAGKDDSNQPTTEVSGDVSYAGALKDGPSHSNGDEGRNESHKTQGFNETQDSPQDRANHSDDSYPDIDPLTLDEHTHQPPQIRPYEKIRWAPFNVPAERRLQTLAVVLHSVSIIATVSMFFALCANPFAWPVLIIYLLHILTSKAHTDGTLRFRSEWFRSSYLWDLFAGYFPAKLHKTHDLPATRKYIFGYHPHGIISHGAWAAFVTDALDFSQKFPGITNSLLTLDSNFRIPLYRDYILAMGVRSVSKDSIVNILSRGGANNEGMGRAVTIVVGGARESLEAQPGLFRLILKQRKGFIKVAVRTGADLVPVLAFGENDLYEQLQPKKHPLVHQVQMFVLRVWKFTLPFLHGRGIFNYDVGLMPFRRPLNIVVGAPIKVQQSNNPSQEEIDRLHGLYVGELQKIWDRYKDEFAPDRKEEMQIV